MTDFNTYAASQPHTVSVPPPLPSLPPRPLLDASSHLSQTWVEQADADEAAFTAQVTSALALALINRIPQRNIGQDALVAADALSNFCGSLGFVELEIHSDSGRLKMLPTAPFTICLYSVC